jgi:hypothetical protein
MEPILSASPKVGTQDKPDPGTLPFMRLPLSSPPGRRGEKGLAGTSYPEARNLGPSARPVPPWTLGFETVLPGEF